MLKYSFVVFHKEYDNFLHHLEDLGVLHIKELPLEPTEEMQEAARTLADIRRIKQRLQTAAALNAAETLPQNDLDTDGQKLLAQIHADSAEAERLEQQLSAIDKELQRYEPWGGNTLKPNAISRLTEAGISVKLYQCQTARFDKNWQADHAVEIVGTRGGMCYFVAFGTAEMPLPDIDAEEVTLSEKSFSQLSEAQAETRQKAAALKAQAAKYAAYGPAILEQYERQTIEAMQLMAAKHNTAEAADGALNLLEGYAPEDSNADLDKWLDAENIVYLKEPATVDDCPPIKLKNSKFAQLFEPITRMYSLPNYSELDVTPLFAPFFTLFFGLCLGDAGYGLIVLVAALIAKSKVSEDMKGYCNLGIVLGAATTVVSLITGMFFGIDLSDPAIGINEGIRKYFITDRNFKIGGYSVLMVFAIVIGLVQILFGMCVNAAKLTKQHGIRHAISTISWIVGLVTAAVTFGLPAVGTPLPEAATMVCYVILALSVVGIFFFNSPQSGVLMNVGSGVWATYNMATGILGDALSYIRLFALGLTGGILGGVFNTMAFQAGDGLPVVAKFIVVLLILLVGHAINIGLCLIGAFVHPMRLTFVEFYKNAGFEGGGKEFKPFKKA